MTVIGIGISVVVPAEMALESEAQIDDEETITLGTEIETEIIGCLLNHLIAVGVRQTVLQGIVLLLLRQVPEDEGEEKEISVTTAADVDITTGGENTRMIITTRTTSSPFLGLTKRSPFLFLS